jgi:hypothetical protein
MGLYLSKELPKQAGRVLEKCVRKIAPEIMTWSQYAGEDGSDVALGGCSVAAAGQGPFETVTCMCAHICRTCTDGMNPFHSR